MKEVILHVGMHKTGTSSIQERLASFDDGTTRYAQFGVPNHSIPMTTIFSSNPYAYHIWRDQGLTAAAVDQQRQAYLSVLEHELASKRHERLIISGEDIGSLKEDEKNRLIEYFNGHGVHLKIVYFIRDPLGLTASLIQQNIRGGLSKLTPITLDYRFGILPFLRRLPRDQLVVRDYRTELDAHDDIVEAFARICEIDISRLPAKYANESLSLAASKLLLRFNRLPVNSFGESERVRARQQLISTIARLFPREHKTEVAGDIVAGLISMSQDDVDFLRETFGITYDLISGGADLAQCQALFDDLASIDLAPLQALFERMGIARCPGDTVDNLLITLYYRLLQGPSLNDRDANDLRDVSMKIAEGRELSIGDAIALMALAQRARPTGPLIQKKLDEYRQRSRALT